VLQDAYICIVEIQNTTTVFNLNVAAGLVVITELNAACGSGVLSPISQAGCLKSSLQLVIHLFLKNMFVTAVMTSNLT
jgi:hypothetical protein